MLIPSSLHSDYSTSLSIKRKKSLKIFKSILDDNLFLDARLSSILKYFTSEAGIKRILSYGEEICFTELKNCPVCSAQDFRYVQTSLGYPRIGYLSNKSQYYRKCTACGHVFLSFVPQDPSDYSKFYDLADSELSYPPPEPTLSLDVKDESYIDNFETAASLIDNEINEFGELPGTAFSLPISILDLGCGSGAFLTLLSNRLVGDSISLNSIDFKVSQGLLLDERISLFGGDVLSFLKLNPGSYDFITAFEFIEHIHPDSLGSFVELAANALKSGGSFICSTPDYDAIGARLTDFWAAYVPQHPSVFTIDSLNLLMSERFKLSFYTHRSYPFKSLNTEVSFYKDKYSCSPFPAKAAGLELMSDLWAQPFVNDVQASLPCEVIAFFKKI